MIRKCHAELVRRGGLRLRLVAILDAVRSRRFGVRPDDLRHEISEQMGSSCVYHSRTIRRDLELLAELGLLRIEYRTCNRSGQTKRQFYAVHAKGGAV